MRLGAVHVIPWFGDLEDCGLQRVGSAKFDHTTIVTTDHGFPNEKGWLPGESFLILFPSV